MRTWANWYRGLLAIWLLFGLPSIVIGYGFSGGHFELPSGDLLEIALWMAILCFLVSPVLLWPFRKGRPGH